MSASLIDLARAHAPFLAIIALLIGAAVVFIGGPSRMTWLLACIAAVFGASAAIDFAVLAFSGQAPQVANVGVVLHLDGVGVFAAALLSFVTVLVALAVGASLNEAGKGPAPAALALLLTIAAGWIGAALARDFIAIIAAVETAWLASVALAAVNAARDRSLLNGALRMLTMGGVATTLIVLGAAMLARVTGTFALDALPLAHIEAPRLAGAGAGLVIIGLALKAGAAPLHAWSPVVLGRAGAIVSLGVGVIGMVGALAMLTRFAAYAIAAPAIGEGVALLLAALGALSVIVGALQAVGARNLLRLATYAGVLQGGGVLLSAALGSPAGFAAALVQLTAFAAAGLALYGGASAGRVQTLEALDGYAQRAPLASAAITAGALSLMGAPLTIGFLGRWRLIEAGVGAGWWWAAGLVIIASLAGVFYGGRLVERMYFRRATSAYAREGGVWRVTLAPALIAAIAIIASGLAPEVLLRAVASASFMLTGVTQ